jgi:hypothetical protein
MHVRLLRGVARRNSCKHLYVTMVHVTLDWSPVSEGFVRDPWLSIIWGGGDCHTDTGLLTTGVALPTEIGAGGQRPLRLLITKGNPTSSRGCYRVVPIEHQLHQVYQWSTRCRQSQPATSSASVIDPNRKQGAGHRGWQLLHSVIFN